MPSFMCDTFAGMRLTFPMLMVPSRAGQKTRSSLRR
jgi:hypothetical protein